MAAMLLVLAACTSKSSQNNQNVNENTEKKEKPQVVEGRKNFGSSHALVTTPQPCVMRWPRSVSPSRPAPMSMLPSSTNIHLRWSAAW